MSFQPVVPMGGYAGWQFLTRTLASQEAAFDAAPVQQRDTTYFAATIGKVTSVDQLMADPKLLKVALGAFGLGDQTGSTALIRKVLTDGTSSATALANQLSDKRYLALAQAFNFGEDGPPNTQNPGFAATIGKAYQDQQFQTAVGQQDTNLQLALQMQSSLANLASGSGSEATKWYTVMGTPAMRAVFQTALGLPSSFVSLDIDHQLQVFEDKAQQAFGDSSVSQFADPAKIDDLVKRFLVRSDTQSGSQASAASIALQLLGGDSSSTTTTGSGGSANTVLSLFS
ncbi:MAG: DUF1217 domain-containing protein [Rhodobacteraceae bacterium]|nr:DUF1217 domain-containing protein [Paracoccaceae bacterium]